MGGAVTHGLGCLPWYGGIYWTKYKFGVLGGGCPVAESSLDPVSTFWAPGQGQTLPPSLNN